MSNSIKWWSNDIFYPKGQRSTSLWRYNFFWSLFNATSQEQKGWLWPYYSETVVNRESLLTVLIFFAAELNMFEASLSTTSSLSLLTSSFRWLLSHHVTLRSVSHYIYYINLDKNKWKLQLHWCMEACNHRVVILVLNNCTQNYKRRKPFLMLYLWCHCTCCDITDWCVVKCVFIWNSPKLYKGQ